MKIARLCQIATISVFFVVLVFPMSFAHRDENRILESENRYAATFPTGENIHSFSDFSSGLEDWVNDNARGRTAADYILRYTKMAAFGIAPEKDCYYGKDDWYFLLTSHSQMPTIHKTDTMDEERLVAFKEKVLSMRAYFEGKGIEYINVTMPHKVEVYPEYLPDTILSFGSERAIDQLNREMTQDPAYAFYVAYDEMMRQKEEHLLYSKAYDNAHWNHYGAFIGYLEMMQAVQKHLPGFEYLGFDDYVLSEVSVDTYQLGRYHTSEPEYLFDPLAPRQAMEDSAFFERIGFETNDMWKSYRYFSVSNSNKPKAIVIGDSYIWMFMLEHLAENFSELVFIHSSDIQNLNLLVDIVEPDIIIQTGLHTEELASIGRYQFPGE